MVVVDDRRAARRPVLRRRSRGAGVLAVMRARCACWASRPTIYAPAVTPVHADGGTRHEAHDSSATRMTPRCRSCSRLAAGRRAVAVDGHHARQPPRRARRRVRRAARAASCHGREHVAEALERGAARGARGNRPGVDAPVAAGGRRGIASRCPTLSAGSARIADRFYGSLPSAAGGGRRHRHQRQDHVRVAARAGASSASGAAAATSARSAPGFRPPRRRRDRHDARRAHAAPAAARRSRDAGATPSRWKCRRTGSTRAASTACGSTSRCSPTSRATISTTTARWSATARRRRGCSGCPGSRTR